MVVGQCDRGSSYHQGSGSTEQDREEQGIIPTPGTSIQWSVSCRCALLSKFPEPPQTEWPLGYQDSYWKYELIEGVSDSSQIKFLSLCRLLSWYNSWLVLGSYPKNCLPIQCLIVLTFHIWWERTVQLHLLKRLSFLQVFLALWYTIYWRKNYY